MTDIVSSIIYYTVAIPYVSPKRATKWHPTTESGPFSVLNRGHFKTKEAAIAWAVENLGGTTYRVREVLHFPEEMACLNNIGEA